MPTTDTNSEGNDNDIKTRKISKLSDNNSQESFLIKFADSPDAAAVSEMEAQLGCSLEKVFPSTPGKEEFERQFGMDRWYEVVVSGGKNVDQMVYKAASFDNVAIAEYSALPVREIEPARYGADMNTKASVEFPFNDPFLPNQWHYKNTGDRSISPNALAGADINVLDVWNTLTCGDPDIIVAVVDEGVKYNHPDLKDNMWVNKGEIPGNGIDDDGNGYVDDVYGYNFVNKGAISWDKNGDLGHGTHCAGTIAAVNNNGIGVAGIAGGSGKGDGCRIMSCQVFSGSSGGSVSTMVRAVKYAADMGASIISCSLGYTVPFESDNHYLLNQGSAEIDAVHYFEASKNNPVLDGNIAIFAAGNEAHNFAHYPGAFVDIISVSAFGPDGLPAYYTNYGPGCNIAAPGGEYYHVANSSASEVLSTLPSELSSNGQNYGYMQGTSMACPHMSGVVALALSYAKKLGKTFTRDEFKQIILSSVSDIDQRINAKSSKTYVNHAPLEMAPYYHQMGAGATDAWRLMMNIEGTPTLTAQIGKTQWIDLTSAFGTASVSLTYLNVEVPEATVNSMGLQKISPAATAEYPAVVDENGYAYVQFGRLYVNPSKIGSGKIKIHAVGGGDHLGGGNNPPGGMELIREVSLIARDVDGANGTGGWL